MVKSNLDALETAFLQLSLAFKLHHFILSKVENGSFDKNSFDIALIRSNGNSNDNYTDIIDLKNNEFNTINDIILSLENNIVINFGVAAMTLWEAINEHCQYSIKNPNQMKIKEEKLAGLCYMIRCCFAHSPAMPVWKIDGRFRMKYTLGNKLIDLTSLNGQSFDQSHIGGYQALWHLKIEASQFGLLE